jgi:hypothetical protein
MTSDEAQGVFALMGWKWQELPLGKGNASRGKMDAEKQDEYEGILKEVVEGGWRQRAGQE